MYITVSEPEAFLLFSAKPHIVLSTFKSAESENESLVLNKESAHQ